MLATRGVLMRGPITLPLVLFALACISIPVLAEGPEQVLSTSTNRKYFPKDWASGYFDFAAAPPHNYPDLNRCASSAGASGGASAPCAAFARYVGSGYMEFRPIGTGQFHRAFVFFEPHAYMGRNIPQFQYSDSMAPIALEKAGGIGGRIIG